jgi:hypothetical protein
MTMKRSAAGPFLALLSLVASGVAGENDKKTVAPAAPEEKWEFKLSLPGWIPSMTGDMGINGAIANVDLGPDFIIPRVDMVADVRAEAHKGRVSLLAEFLYMSLSDGIGTNSIVKKIDVRMDQTMGDLGVGWRAIASDRGYLDVTAGVRYNNLYQRQTVQPNDERIGEVIDELAEAAGSELRSRLERALRILRGKDPTVPIAPLAGGEAARLAAKIAGIKGTAAERRVKIADRLHDSLDRTISRTDDWWDPYLGLRGRYNLTRAFYLTAKGDIGGFGVGSQLTWTAEAALGIQLSRNIYSEIGYRAFAIDYERHGLVVDTITHGPQVTLGLQF